LNSYKQPKSTSNYTVRSQNAAHRVQDLDDRFDVSSLDLAGFSIKRGRTILSIAFGPKTVRKTSATVFAAMMLEI